jgi:hypothetical protein
MAWPCLKTKVFTPKRHEAPTLAGCFYLTRGEYVYNFCKRPTSQRVEILHRLDGFQDLPEDVIAKLSVMSRTELVRLEELWRSIEDCLILSSPELTISRVIPRWVWRIWRWATTCGVHSVDHVTSMWKAFSLHIRQLNAGMPEPALVPAGFPWLNRGKLGKQWYKNLPWLALALMSPCKEFQMRLSHLCSTRNFPAPSLTKKRVAEEFDDYRERLCRKWPIYERLRNASYQIGKRISHFVKGSEVPTEAHLSLSATASFEAPRNMGGRVISFLRDFLDDYVKVCPTDEFITGETWFGARYCREEGKPLFMTMCRAIPLKTFEGKVNFLESNFDTPFLIPGLDPLYRIEEPIFGLDCCTGYQFLQYSIERGIRSGVLVGSKYKSQFLLGVSPTRHAKVRAQAIGEPGNKVRWITIAEDWETVFLQPLGHELAPILSAHPSLTSGFLRSWKGWDFACNLARRKKAPSPDQMFLFGDLEAASDNMTFAYTRALLYGLLDGANRSLPLFKVMVDLLTSPHDFYKTTGPVAHGDFDFVFTSSNGILMGHPGTKEAVSANWLLAHELAICYRYAKTDIDSFLNSPRPIVDDYSESAGDDFIEIGDKEYLDKVILCHRLLGHRINNKKLIITRRAGQYCEEPLIIEGHSLIHERPLWEVPYEEHIHVDAIKVRLLSPYGKVDPTIPGESLPNPAIGKAQALAKKLSWLPPLWKNFGMLITRRWFFRMGRYVHWKQALCYVPTHFGGAGMPLIPEAQTLVLELIRDKVYGLLCLDVLHGSADGFTRRCLRTLSTGGEIRGLEFDVRERAHEEYVLSAAIVGQMKTLDEIAAESGLSPDEVRNLGRAKKRTIAHRLNYIPEFDMNLLIEKAWVVKEALQIAANLRDFEEPKAIDYEEGFNSLRSALEMFPQKYMALMARRYGVLEKAELWEAIVSRRRPRTGEERFVSRDILSGNFSLLETPMPASADVDRAHVRGSIAEI